MTKVSIHASTRLYTPLHALRTHASTYAGACPTQTCCHTPLPLPRPRGAALLPSRARPVRLRPVCGEYTRGRPEHACAVLRFRVGTRAMCGQLMPVRHTRARAASPRLCGTGTRSVRAQAGECRSSMLGVAAGRCMRALHWRLRLCVCVCVCVCVCACMYASMHTHIQ